MNGRSRAGLLAALAALLLVALAAAAAADRQGQSPLPPLSAAEGKVSTELLALADDRFLLPNQSRGEVVAALASSGHYAPAGRRHRAVGTPAVDLVEVYVRTDPGTGAEALRPYIHRVSAEDAGAGLVAAWVAPGRVLDLASVPSVREIRPVQRAAVRTGSITSAGDTLLRTAELRSATGLSGAGIRVGVISDGVDHRASAQSTGDLPQDLLVLGNAVGGDEGTAMLEIVHDIAPNASLVFHDCGWNILEFNRAVDALADAGCRVIVDDIGWVDEPFFEDGVVAAHVAATVRDRGLIYVSAAGNDGGLHYQGEFRDDGHGAHDFSQNGSSARKRLYADLSPGDSVTVILQWAEPFGEAGSNYDLALYSTADPTVPLSVASRVQDGDDDPIEVLSWVNGGTTAVEVEVGVSKPAAAPARTLELFVYPHGGGTIEPENMVPEDSIYGHPAAEGVIAAGAIDSTDPAGERLEPYSSRGPVTIIAPAPETRQKPDCAGVDGVRVTGAGSFPSGFWGTSAAAPHAAALAALVWSGRQDAPAAQVRAALVAAADDLGPSGADGGYGAGRLNATAVYDLVASSARPATSLPGRIEAEDFDTGGEGVAYHDDEPANLGGVYRPAEGVDIEPLPGSAGFNVGWVRPGEWLRYTVDVATPGAYTVRVRAASRWGEQSLSLLVDAGPAVTVPVANLASFDDFAVTNATLRLTAGEHQLRAVLSGYCNLDYLDFELGDAPVRLPGTASDPRDLDGDGKYEDVNGNGRPDFADVVLFFNQMDWIAANEPLGGFDHNGNGRVDFADVTRLFATR